MIDTKDVVPGMYFVNLVQDGSRAMKKLIIQ
jgi:hypothetical protein